MTTCTRCEQRDEQIKPALHMVRIESAACSTSMVQWSDLSDTFVKRSAGSRSLIVQMPADGYITINGVRFNMNMLLSGKQ